MTITARIKNATAAIKARKRAVTSEACFHALTISFKAPEPTEFGYKYCKNNILYLKASYESKPLWWFLGHSQDHSYTMAWRGDNDDMCFWDKFSLYAGPSSSVDGTYPLDNYSAIRYQRLASESKSSYTDFFSAFDRFRSDTSDNKPCIVITNKLEYDNLVKEMNASLLVSSFKEFEAIITHLASSRYGRTNFSAKKKVVQKVVERPMKSMSILCEVKTRLYDKVQKASSETPLASDYFNLDDDEIMSLWNSRVNSVDFVDARALINISTSAIDAYCGNANGSISENKCGK